MTSGNSRDSAAPGGKRQNRSKTSPRGSFQAGPPVSGELGGTASPLRSPPLAAFQHHVCRPGKDEERRYKYKLSDRGEGRRSLSCQNPNTSVKHVMGVSGSGQPRRIRQTPHFGRGVGSKCGLSRAGRGELVTVTETCPCSLHPQPSPVSCLSFPTCSRGDADPSRALQSNARPEGSLP